MSNEEFRRALDALGLSQTEAARRFRVGLRSVQHWVAGTHKVPPPVEVLLETWRANPELLLEDEEEAR